ncbi:MAG: DUF4097 family beta strand repeat-containing protein [Acidimicrobiales bacterium]|jgi:hypothetical protein
MEWTFPASGPLKADLELSAGQVEVALHASDEILVLLEALGRENDGVREQIANTSVACDGGRLDVHVPKRKLREASLRLRVLIPAGSSVRVRTSSADVACDGPMSAFEGKTASGDIVVRDDCESASIATASGDIRLVNVLGQLDVASASGDVTARNIGGRVTVTTASGDIRLGSIAHDARTRSASGDVTIACAYDGELSVNTASGDVRVGVGAGVGAWLDLVTVSGDSRCTLPAEGEGSNSATLRISCRTVSGDILVHSGERSPGDGDGGGGGGGPAGLGLDVAGDGGSALPGSPEVPGAEPFADTGMSGGGPSGTGIAGDAAFPGAGFPDTDDFSGADEFGGMSGFPDLSGIAGLAKLADLAEIAGFGDVADLMMGRPTTGRGIRLPWRKA